MYVGRDFPPAEQGESLVYGLDFVDDLSPGEQILRASWDLIVTQGDDPLPSSHLQGLAAVRTQPGNAVPTLTVQRIGGLLPGVTYATHANVQTDFGNVVNLYSHIRGVSVK